MKPVDLSRPGVWTTLFPKALSLMKHLETQTRRPLWTFGGGTVLMLRIGHRQSRDIDLFVNDPQYLGFINPRLSDVAGGISTNYEEGAEYIKLFLPVGEIDVVVGSALTAKPWQTIAYAGRTVKVETCAEIIAKKFWHRGDRARARDLFDLCAVAEAEPAAITRAAPFMVRHGAAFLHGLEDRASLLEAEFNAIDAMGFTRPFADCREQANRIVKTVLAGDASRASPVKRPRLSRR